MTPDEVVARAKELVGQEVLLTVRGVVRRNAGYWEVGRVLIEPLDYEARADFVNIEPAPMRIEKGQRYADAEGRLFEGDSDGGLWELAAGYILAGEVWELDGLRPVRVVDA